MIALAPYMISHSVLTGLWFSVGITLVALLIFGYIKGHFTGIHPLRGKAYRQCSPAGWPPWPHSSWPN